VKEPVFGLAARWVPVEFQAQAEIFGNTVVDRSTLDGHPPRRDRAAQVPAACSAAPT
jgi:hypothetical protein